MVLEKGGARATEKLGQTRTEKYEFGKLSISSDLAKDNFGGAVAVEAGLNRREIKVKNVESVKPICLFLVAWLWRVGER